MTSLSINRPRGEATKKLILDTAIRLASTHGIQGITIGELAKAIGMSKSGLFAHFENKDNLQLEILKLASDNFVEKVMKPSYLKEKGLPRLIAFYENWMSFLKDDSELPGGSIFIAASFELDDRPGVLKDFVQKTQNDLILNIEKTVQMAVDCGHLKESTNKKEFAWKFYSFVMGFHHFKRMLNNPRSEEFIQNAFKDLVNTNKK